MKPTYNLLNGRRFAQTYLLSAAANVKDAERLRAIVRSIIYIIRRLDTSSRETFRYYALGATNMLMLCGSAGNGYKDFSLQLR